SGRQHTLHRRAGHVCPVHPDIADDLLRQGCDGFEIAGDHVCALRATVPFDPTRLEMPAFAGRGGDVGRVEYYGVEVGHNRIEELTVHDLDRSPVATHVVSGGGDCLGIDVDREDPATHPLPEAQPDHC